MLAAKRRVARYLRELLCNDGSATEGQLTTYHSTGPGPTTGDHEPRRDIYGGDTPGGEGASYGFTAPEAPSMTF